MIISKKKKKSEKKNTKLKPLRLIKYMIYFFEVMVIVV